MRLSIGISLGVIVSTAFSLIALGGPEPIATQQESKDKEVAMTAPPPRSWTGFYVGGTLGYKFASTNTDIDLFGEFDVSPIEAIEDMNAIEAHSPRDLDRSGMESGGLIGYNYELRNHWVLGIEATGAYVWLERTVNNYILSQSGTTFSERTHFSTDYLVTVGPRIGYAMGRWLPYVTGGLALGDFDFNQGIHAGEFPFLRGEDDEMNVGWMAGAGLQFALCHHWSVRGQYSYVDLGTAGFNARLGGDPTSSYQSKHSASLHEHNADVSVIYQF